MQGGPSHHDKPLINILAWPKAVATLITVGMVRMKDFLYLFGSGYWHCLNYTVFMCFKMYQNKLRWWLWSEV